LSDIKHWWSSTGVSGVVTSQKIVLLSLCMRIVTVQNSEVLCMHEDTVSWIVMTFL
jgi:hypothetical protein